MSFKMMRSVTVGIGVLVMSAGAHAAVTLDAEYTGGAFGTLIVTNQSDESTPLTIVTPGGGPSVRLTSAKNITVNAVSGVNVVGSGTTSVVVTINDGAFVGAVGFQYVGNGQDDLITLGNAAAPTVFSMLSLGTECAITIDTSTTLGGNDTLTVDYFVITTGGGSFTTTDAGGVNSLTTITVNASGWIRNSVAGGGSISLLAMTSITIAGNGLTPGTGGISLEAPTVTIANSTVTSATMSITADDLVLGDGSGAADSAILQLAGAGQIVGTPNVSVASDGKLDLNGQSKGIGTLTMDGGTVASGAGTLTLGGNVTVAGAANATATVSGNLNLGGAIRTFTVANGGADVDCQISAVTSNGGVTKAGAGALRLTGANTYAGATTVNAGVLQVTGSIVNSATTLTAGTFGGTGTAGTITATGGTLAPGVSPGALACGNLTLSAANSLSLEINGTTAGVQYDQLNVTGSVDLSSATLGIDLGVFTPSAGDTFTIISNDGNDAVVGQFAQGQSITVNGVLFFIDYAGGDGNDVVLLAPWAIATLGSLSVSPGTLTPAFDARTTSYAVTVASQTTSIAVTVAPAQQDAAITLNGNTVTPGAATSVSLNPGANVIHVVVTAQNKTTTEEYTITVNRASSSGSSITGLTDLTLTPGTLVPAFDADTFTYSVDVDSDTSTIQVVPTLRDVRGVLKLNGIQQQSTAPFVLHLAVGANVLTIETISENRSFRRDYQVAINRAASTDATLATLAVTPGELSPTFDANVTSYTVAMDYTIPVIGITPTAAEAGATITVNGTAQMSGTITVLPVAVGSNSFSIVVTAPDGTTQKTYTLTVTRAAETTTSPLPLLPCGTLGATELGIMMAGLFLLRGTRRSFRTTK
ncbi:MAG TPA: cadherin-like beta sandwich domain-containing protein [Phycisphaerae bacterium]|nr:cadherin-like beta sandwich domain-containing protein [Phycisphaerae bacterium]HRY68966.1 cadherin-like beta sandwich domain-containing protein [Phycisphaerae bacterium]HSA25793.1 cadherin-like beta sandwich domain-containing protein [Phycisphaerae bacterium]